MLNHLDQRNRLDSKYRENINNTYMFTRKSPKKGDFIIMFWEDGSECECVFEGLDKNIKPLPTRWCYGI